MSYAAKKHAYECERISLDNTHKDRYKYLPFDIEAPGKVEQQEVPPLKFISYPLAGLSRNTDNIGGKYLVLAYSRLCPEEELIRGLGFLGDIAFVLLRHGLRFSCHASGKHGVC